MAVVILGALGADQTLKWIVGTRAAKAALANQGHAASPSSPRYRAEPLLLPGLARAPAVVLCLAGLVGLPLNWRADDLRGQRYARHLAEDMLAEVEPGAVLFVDGDTLIHAMWYLQGVEDQAPETIVISSGHMVLWYLEQLAARHPDVLWPALAPGRDPTDHVRLIIEALGRSRPVYLSSSMNPEPLLGTREGGPGPCELLEKGLVRQVVPRGSADDRLARGLASYAAVTGAIHRLGEIRPHVDMETKSIYLQYALAAYETAEVLRLAGRSDLACEACRLVLCFDPDRHEADLREDVRQGLGKEIPKLDLGRRARVAIGAMCGPPQVVSPLNIRTD